MVQDLAAGLKDLEAYTTNSQRTMRATNSRYTRANQSTRWSRKRALVDGIRFHNAIIE